MTTAIAIDGVTKVYKGGLRALNNLSFEVQTGEIFGLLGRNGAGKTTLIKVLLNIVRATSGSAELLGHPTRDSKARRQIGYLPEDHRFSEYRTGAQTLDFFARLSGVAGSERRRRIPLLLDAVGLVHAGNRKIRHYSKGMKQRLGLAQAMIHDPSLIFLDEPTDGVDPQGRAEVRAMLQHLKNKGCTIFLNSHLLGEVEQLCDRVAIIDGGELLRVGTVGEMTHVKGVYTIGTQAAPSEATMAALKPFLIGSGEDRLSFDVGLRDEDELDAVLDLLRESGSKVRHLAAKKLTLEDVFLSAIKKQPEAGQ